MRDYRIIKKTDYRVTYSNDTQKGTWYFTTENQAMNEARDYKENGYNVLLEKKYGNKWYPRKVK